MIAYEVHALRYATNTAARRPHNFIGGDPHDVEMPLDYYIWILRGGGRVFVVDTGFDRAMAQARKREFLAAPDVLLGELDIDAATVADVVLTHLHYDHAGNIGLFPNAVFHIQDREMAYATGRYMCHDALRQAFEGEHVASAVLRLFEGRLRFHDGVSTLAPGVELHRVGGHTDGLQVVRVWTARGWMVLASDASHFYDNMDQGRGFPIVFHHGDMLEGHRRCRELADTPDGVIPGHDPAVMTRYPASSPDLTGRGVRLDQGPIVPAG